MSAQGKNSPLVHSLEGCPSATIWNKIGIHSHHGISLPLFSLRSKEGCGIGEFLDLIPLIHWCHSIGFDTLQLLPLNDRGEDPSPYNSLSSCALDPIYLSLKQLPFLEEFPLLKVELASFEPLLLPQHIPYLSVKRQKISWLRKYFGQAFSKIKEEPSFQKFLDTTPWAKPYALFSAIRESQNEKNWKEWPPHLRTPSPETFPSLYQQYLPSFDFYLFLQYLCFSQVEEVKNYATKKGVFLMSDLPFLVSSASADLWLYPNLFDEKWSAGAPPDLFSPEGQKWGFPIFQWTSMEKNNFSWWTYRLEALARYSHLYRIDHAIGFFRIWAIPQEENATHGCFIPENPQLWIDQGERLLLRLIQISSLLPIAEDLGLIPKGVPATLKKLGICGTKLIRWERKWESDGSFIPVEEYEPISLTTVSTHDSEPLQLWWETNRYEAVLYSHFQGWEYSPSFTFEKRKAILKESHKSASLFHVNPLQEFLGLFPELVWENPRDERINIPGTTLPTNWTYRFRPFLEDILSNTELIQEIKEIIRS